ncbi:RimK family alpha-L-glutamate ligase [Actinomadura sp. 6N118]|uniref:RimK family alpha-L-glutamate ligase n=1 Tax=Actinomadura sp. 6N118 TaxID=3375151 RepID=UPI00378B4B97
MSRARVCVLVEAGSDAGRNPLLRPLGAALAARGVDCTAFDATAPWTPADLPAADVFLVKGGDPAVLCAAGAAADAGGICLNDLATTLRVIDKARVLALLDRAGLPVPATTIAADADAVADLLCTAGTPRFVKPLRGRLGRGAGVLRPGERPVGAGPWLVQEVIDGPGFDYKVCGVGGQAAVLQVHVEPGRLDVPRIPVPDPDLGLVRLGLRTADLCGLVCWGVDVVTCADGPVIVDVNTFPGYRGVPAAADWIADAALATAGAAGGTV